MGAARTTLWRAPRRACRAPCWGRGQDARQRRRPLPTQTQASPRDRAVQAGRGSFVFRKRNELRDISSVAAGSLMSAVPGAQALRTVALTAGGGAQEPRPPRSPRQRPHSAPGGALGAEPLRGPRAAPRAWHGVLVPRTFGRRARPFARVPGPRVAPAAGGHQGWHRWRCQARGAQGWGRTHRAVLARLRREAAKVPCHLRRGSSAGVVPAQTLESGARSPLPAVGPVCLSSASQIRLCAGMLPECRRDLEKVPTIFT